jgi:TPP-dependent pyruvate/acetoin dehydrogenase alpha subunit
MLDDHLPHRRLGLAPAQLLDALGHMLRASLAAEVDRATEEAAASPHPAHGTLFEHLYGAGSD